DVDLAIIRPVGAAVGLLAGEHPDGRPGAAAGGQAGADLDAAVRPARAREQPGRRVRAPLHTVLPGLDDEVPVFDARVFGAALGVVLQLVVAPAVPADVVAPPGRVGQAVGLELVGPDELPFAVARSDGLGRLTRGGGDEDEGGQQAAAERATHGHSSLTCKWWSAKSR